MTVKKTVSGKHPLTVRVDDEVYMYLRMMCAEMNLSVNEYLAKLGGDAVVDWLKRRKE